jgi:RNA polymerase-binding transcription factor DksA
MVVNKEEIIKASLEYCLHVLTKNEMEEDFKGHHEHKEDLPKELFNKKDDKEDDLNEEDFWRTLDRLKLKNKKSYNFIVKSGDKYKEAVFGLCRRVLDDEEIPKKFDETLLIPIFKGVGSFQDLSHSRFIHTKFWTPRL